MEYWLFHCFSITSLAYCFTLFSESRSNIRHVMDLRSRTLLGRQADCSDRDDTAEKGRENDEKQTSSPTLL